MIGRRTVQAALVAALVLVSAQAALADLESRTYQFKDRTILETAVTTEGGLRLDSVRFQLPMAVEGRASRTAGVSVVEVAVSNTTAATRKAGLSVALFDDAGRLLAVASGGSKIAALKPGRQKKYTLIFEGANAEVHLATTFQISIESKP